MSRIILIAAAIISAAAMVALLGYDAEGCAPVPRRDRPGDYIRIAEESAIIVWDPVKKVEHFIRRAAFDTKSPDFGFLVPTPAKPVLAEVEDGIFRTMNTWMVPKVVEKTRLNMDAVCLTFCMFAGSKHAAMDMVGGAAKDSVRVLGEQKVGGFDTAILEADSTEDLAKWLNDHGYSNDPALQSWLFPYVTSKWKITAFKISHDATTGQLATTKPVRMSFAADRPFFPYREPERKEVEVRQPIRPEPTEIDGIWKVESAEGDDVAKLADGKGASKLPGTRFHFVDGVAVGAYLKDSKYTVDPSNKPKQLNIRSMLGIYEIDGDTLRWCQGRTTRPAKFSPAEGLLLVLHRDRKAETQAAAARVNQEVEQRLHGSNRLLRVFFVSDGRAEGKLGDATWHAKVPWSDAITDGQRTQLIAETGVPESDLPAKAWMTMFEDRSSPRPGKEEVYFDPSKDQTPVLPPPIIHYHDIWIPVDVVIGLAIFGFLVVVGLVRWLRRHPTEL